MATEQQKRDFHALPAPEIYTSEKCSSVTTCIGCQHVSLHLLLLSKRGNNYLKILKVHQRFKLRRVMSDMKNGETRRQRAAACLTEEVADKLRSRSVVKTQKGPWELPGEINISVQEILPC